jgi:hypothetical protein
MDIEEVKGVCVVFVPFFTTESAGCGGAVLGSSILLLLTKSLNKSRLLRNDGIPVLRLSAACRRETWVKGRWSGFVVATVVKVTSPRLKNGQRVLDMRPLHSRGRNLSEVVVEREREHLGLHAALGELRHDRIRNTLVCGILSRDDARKRRCSAMIWQAHDCVCAPPRKRSSQPFCGLVHTSRMTCASVDVALQLIMFQPAASLMSEMASGAPSCKCVNAQNNAALPLYSLVQWSSMAR